MKKITMIALAMFTAVGAGAQTIYDATNIAQKELNGTARFVGMGGAMGALGGDICLGNGGVHMLCIAHQSSVVQIAGFAVITFPQCVL